MDRFGTLEGRKRSKHPDAYLSGMDVFSMVEGKHPSIHPSARVVAQKVARGVKLGNVWAASRLYSYGR